MRLSLAVLPSLLYGSFGHGVEGPIFRRTDVDFLQEAYRRSLQEHKPVCFGYMTTVLATLSPGQATSPAGASTIPAGNGKSFNIPNRVDATQLTIDAGTGTGQCTIATVITITQTTTVGAPTPTGTPAGTLTTIFLSIEPISGPTAAPQARAAPAWKFWDRRQAPAPVAEYGYLGNAETPNPKGCSDARTFVIDDGQLLYASGPANGLSVDPGVPMINVPDAQPGSIVTFFSIVGSQLRWTDSSFYNNRARFCQAADGMVWAAFVQNGSPTGCVPVNLVTYSGMDMHASRHQLKTPLRIRN